MSARQFIVAIAVILVVALVVSHAVALYAYRVGLTRGIGGRTIMSPRDRASFILLVCTPLYAWPYAYLFNGNDWTSRYGFGFFYCAMLAAIIACHVGRRRGQQWAASDLRRFARKS